MKIKPYVLEETSDFAVVFKPSGMHSVPLKPKSGSTLLEWYALAYPEAEIMHRLDCETHGLVLFSKNADSFDFFKEMQDNGKFIKEYSAVCKNSVFASLDDCITAAGFPPSPVFSGLSPSSDNPFVVESFFRPFGPGRKQVRPVIDDGKKHHETAKDKGGTYKTEIIMINDNVFFARLRRGFRHQIRCHLCWIGCPILGDSLYARQDSCESGQTLALRAHALFFPDPSTGEQREYRIEPLH
ncbi:MAG: RNA pseudouridine synthase [Treponema sp.]|jgi:23S rRNA pseudouridine1911/1915/1917 synthase|nr:RNA pseudouridine synthase [Treponema sp.]